MAVYRCMPIYIYKGHTLMRLVASSGVHHGNHSVMEGKGNHMVTFSGTKGYKHVNSLSPNITFNTLVSLSLRFMCGNSAECFLSVILLTDCKLSHI